MTFTQLVNRPLFKTKRFLLGLIVSLTAIVAGMSVQFHRQVFTLRDLSTELYLYKTPYRDGSYKPSQQTQVDQQNPWKQVAIKGYLYQLKKDGTKTEIGHPSMSGSVLSTLSSYEEESLWPFVHYQDNNLYYFDSTNQLTKYDLRSKQTTQISSGNNFSTVDISDMYVTNLENGYFFLQSDHAFLEGGSYVELMRLIGQPTDEGLSWRLASIGILKKYIYFNYKIVGFLPSTSEIVLMGNGGDGGCGSQSVWKVKTDGTNLNKVFDGSMCVDMPGKSVIGVIGDSIIIEEQVLDADQLGRPGYLIKKNLYTGEEQKLTIVEGFGAPFMRDGEVFLAKNGEEETYPVSLEPFQIGEKNPLSSSDAQFAAFESDQRNYGALETRWSKEFWVAFHPEKLVVKIPGDQPAQEFVGTFYDLTRNQPTVFVIPTNSEEVFVLAKREF